MCGEIVIESKLGVGTTIKVKLKKYNKVDEKSNIIELNKVTLYNQNNISSGTKV